MLDNYDLWRAHDARQERELAKFPVCNYCFQPITDEKAILLDGEWWHTDCMIDQFEVSIEEYFE